MSNAIYTKPFTQIVEDTMLEMREANFADTNIEKKYQRRVNDVYRITIPGEYEFFDFMKKKGYLTMSASLSGTATVTINSTSVTYPTAGMSVDAYANFSFTVPTTNEVYTVVSNTASVFTITPAYLGATGSVSFRVYKSVYPLASDYEFMTTEPGFWIEYSAGRQHLDWDDDRDWKRDYTTQTGLYPRAIREYTEKDSTGLSQVEIMPPVTSARLVWYEYYKSLPEMREFTTGTASTTANSTSVTLSADYSAYVSTGQYFRIDSDGTWKKITGVSGATVTLASGYPATFATKPYTISDVPDIPSYLHMAIFYGACILTAQEQGETQINITAFLTEYKAAISNAISKQNKKRYGRKILRFNPSTRVRRRIE